MATVVIQRCFPDGGVLTIRVKAKTSYPDALCEAKRTALDAYFEALADTLAAVVLTEDEA